VYASNFDANNRIIVENMPNTDGLQISFTPNTELIPASDLILNGSRFSTNYSLSLNNKNDTDLNIMDGLQAYWSCDEYPKMDISNVNDENGYMNLTALLSRSNTIYTYGVGKIGNACVFKNTNVDKYTTGQPNVSGWSSITLAYWAKMNSVVAAGGIIGNGASSYLNRSFNSIFGSTIQFRVYNATTFKTSVSPFAPNAGEWYHVVGTYDGANTKLYVNGTLVDTDALMGNMLTTNSIDGDLILGWAVNNSQFNGSIDEIYILNRSLNYTEVATLYNTSLRPTAMPIVTITGTSGGILQNISANFTTNNAAENVSLYGRPHGTPTWYLIESGINNGQTYINPPELQLNAVDFGVLMQGNGSSSPIIYSITTGEETPTNPTTAITQQFINIGDVVYATTGIMSPILNLIVSIIPVLITLAVIGLILGLVVAIKMIIRKGMRRRR